MFDFIVRSDYNDMKVIEVVSNRVGRASEDFGETTESLSGSAATTPVNTGLSTAPPRNRDKNMAAEHPSSGLDRAQRRASRTRKRLLDAAYVLFSEKGVDATAIEDITERADLGKGTFYRHFSNKEAVLNALVENAVERLAEGIRSKQKPQSLGAALEQMMAAHLKFLTEDVDRYLLLFQGRVLPRMLRSPEGELDAAHQQYLQELERQVGAFVPQPLTPAKIRRLATAMAGYVLGASSLAAPELAPEERDKALEPLRRAFVAALAATLAK